MSNTIRFTANSNSFFAIDTCPISYWISNKYFDAFKQFNRIGDVGDTKKGVLTGNDNRFVRLWFEISSAKFGLGISNHAEMISINKKWIPATGGGTYRKWYGNFENVINMENDAFDIRNNKENSFRLREKELYFKECTTWSEVSGRGLSMRYVPNGILFGNSGPVCFWKSNIFYWLAFLNSKIVIGFLTFLSPTLTFGPEQIKRVPCKEENVDLVESISKELVIDEKEDWDSFETSWDFQRHPLI